MDDYFRATALVNLVTIQALLVTLERRALLERRDTLETLELALTNLETQQAHAVKDDQPIRLARQMLEDLISQLRLR